MRMINDTDRPIKLRAGTQVGILEPVELLRADLDKTHDCFQANATSTEGGGCRHSESSEVPEFLKDLILRSSKELSETQQQALTNLLVEFQDTFAQHDLDIGCLHEVTHKIDTGTEEPIRQRMRRTPAPFQEQEREHLDKMLVAGVIQPSNSEWSSAPVLVRKKDGSL
ncbi:uncharacterized protein [Argopecten irradians]|uniref:uncharacterized protein n=1 Tax=Argopecten irradians TaxID=31199 RepID=UPI00371BD673